MAYIRQILLVLAGTLLGLSARADDYLLYWQVEDSAKVDGVTLDNYSSWYARANNNFDYGGNSGKIAGARAVFYDSNGNGPSLMNIYTADPWRDTGAHDAIIIDNNYTVVGTGAGQYSYFSVSDPSQLSFAIELGNWEGGEWVVLATTERMSYSSLTVSSQDGVHILQMADNVDLNNYQAWAPAAYNVPEPSSGLLVLIGVGLLALRRGRARAPRAPLGRRRG